MGVKIMFSVGDTLVMDFANSAYLSVGEDSTIIEITGGHRIQVPGANNLVEKLFYNDSVDLTEYSDISFIGGKAF